MSSAEFRFRQLTPRFGLEVVGLDLREEPTAEQKDRLCRAWHENALLLFRGQELDEERRLDVCRIFGELSFAGPSPDRDLTKQFYISNVQPGGNSPYGELGFHSDRTFSASPLRGLALYAIEVVPEGEGGETLYANVRLAYELLPASLKEKIRNLQIVHSLPDQTKQEAIPGPGTAPDNPTATHPLTFPHPITGETLLFCSARHFDRIEGMSAEEGRALALELTTYVNRPEVVYKHVWRPGDLIVWDNLQLQHARTYFDPKHRRHMHRIQIGMPERVLA